MSIVAGFSGGARIEPTPRRTRGPRIPTKRVSLPLAKAIEAYRRLISGESLPTIAAALDATPDRIISAVQRLPGRYKARIREGTPLSPG